MPDYDVVAKAASKNEVTNIEKRSKEGTVGNSTNIADKCLSVGRVSYWNLRFERHTIQVLSHQRITDATPYVAKR